MRSTALTDLLTSLRRSFRSAVEPTDAQLLASFVAIRDERAFETLVLRHGPMVLGVCRRVLGHAQDAEDALQATFLILARKAGSVRPADAVARWLHGVAYHTALKARVAGARRRVREGHARPRPNAAGPDDWFEIRPMLDQELNRLSDDYRAVVLLCDLEGLTRREAALQLGWPEGTVAGRLARARELLANRLTRRGVALSAAGLATALAEEIASAAPSLTMVSAALKAALTSQTPPAVAVLANSVLHAGVATRLWSAALLIVVLALGGAGVCFYSAHATGNPKAESPPAGQKPPEIIKPIAVPDPWVPLFNGKDLTGWFVEGGDPGAWQVERDELLVDAAKGSRRYNFLLTKKTYSEFLLRFEYQLSQGANSGVALWATPNEKVYREGPIHLEVKLLDDPSYPNIGWPTGTLFWNLDGGSHLLFPDRRAKLEPVGSWNHAEVEARAQSLRVSVNGLEVLSARPDKLAAEPGAFAGLKRCSGHVGLEKGNAGVVRFRTIAIKELKPASKGTSGVQVRDVAVKEVKPAAVAAAAENKDDSAKKELDKLKGSWACVGYEKDGVEQLGKAARKTQYNEELCFTVENVTGGRLHLAWTLDRVSSCGAGVYQFHSTTEPKGIDLTWEGGGYEMWGKGPPPKYRDKIQPGVYSVEGDRLRLCWGEVGSTDRPTSVRTKQGDKRTVLIYERNTTVFGIGQR